MRPQSHENFSKAFYIEFPRRGNRGGAGRGVAQKILCVRSFRQTLYAKIAEIVENGAHLNRTYVGTPKKFVHVAGYIPNSTMSSVYMWSI